MSFRSFLYHVSLTPVIFASYNKGVVNPAPPLELCWSTESLHCGSERMIVSSARDYSFLHLKEVK